MTPVTSESLFDNTFSGSNIITLLDESASRQAILDGFKWLILNENIKRRDDPIIIYFTGHGSQVQKLEDWEDWSTVTSMLEIFALPISTPMLEILNLGPDKAYRIVLLLQCHTARNVPKERRQHSRSEAITKSESDV
ncbi:hypothetical protein BDN72DRAFT_848647 [Pluteus cervinus]|uniref:Uncharacterized protein n=1 Tax=Pluteus cervinus TaxID=181527 RepID=A0ACD3A9Z1_9AGAR|nr:hypothetical protein BDN72DRAFT_848647 [Pluteus cervinus]